MESSTNDSQSFDRLLQALHNPNADIRLQAVETLGKLGNQLAVEPLIQLLHNDDTYYIRQGAVRALKKLGGPKVIDAFITALNDYAVMSTVASNLVEWKVERAIQPILEILEKGQGRVGHHWGLTAQVLAEFGEPAFFPLVKALENPKVAGLAAYALGQMGDKRAVEPLIKMLKNRNLDEMERRAVIMALRSLKDPEAFEILKQVVADPIEPALVRDWAAQALGSYGEPSLPTLFEILKKDESVGYAAVGGLALAGEAAIPPLTENLNDQDSTLRAHAAMALGMVGGLPSLIPANNTSSYEVKPQLVEPLIQALSDKDHKVRENAVMGIWNILFSLNMQSMLQKQMQGQLPPEIVSQISQHTNFDREKLLEPILNALKDENSEVRYKAAMVLGQLGVKDNRVIQGLKAALNDEAEDVRFRANEALLTLESP